MKKIGFLGLGVMGLPMALNVLKKSGYPVLGFDVAQARLDQFAAAGGETTSDPVDIYKTCDVIMQMLPTHPIIINSIKQAVQYGKPGNIILDLDSTAPDIIQELYPEVEAAGMHLLDSPVSGGNPMAIAGTLAIMTGGDKAVFEEVKPLLECMGHPVYTGGSASGSITKLVRTCPPLPRATRLPPRQASTCKPRSTPPAAALQAARCTTTRCLRLSTGTMSRARALLSI